MTSGRPYAIVMTCEHASSDVPAELRRVFRGSAEVRRTHRGYDIGALEIAERMAAALGAPLLLGRWSRLVVDLNRSATNRAVFSEWARRLDRAEREDLIERYHEPYRAAVERLCRALLAEADVVVHLSVHTFTPVLRGKVRDVDIGLLFDPAREKERSLAQRWRSHLAEARSDLRVRLNRPYRGTSDGLTTHLRARFALQQYAGIEVEVNQQMASRRARCRRIADDLDSALRASIAR